MYVVKRFVKVENRVKEFVCVPGNRPIVVIGIKYLPYFFDDTSIY